MGGVAVALTATGCDKVARGGKSNLLSQYTILGGELNLHFRIL